MVNRTAGEDIRGGFDLAKDDISAVADELHDTAKETRFQGLVGKDRDEFLKGLTQSEYDTLHDIAQAQGPRGLSKLQSMMMELRDLQRGS
jgi:hypothetical protein